jgi:hypothetical protein
MSPADAELLTMLGMLRAFALIVGMFALIVGGTFLYVVVVDPPARWLFRALWALLWGSRPCRALRSALAALGDWSNRWRDGWDGK